MKFLMTQKTDDHAVFTITTETFTGDVQVNWNGSYFEYSAFNHFDITTQEYFMAHEYLDSLLEMMDEERISL